MRAKISIGIIILLLMLVHPAQAQEVSYGPIWSYETDNAVWEVSISSDGNYIAAGSFDDTVYFFNREGKLLWQYKTGTIVTSVSISSEGNYIAAGSASHSYISDEYGVPKVYLFNRDGKLLWSYEPDGRSVKKVSTSSDGNYIVAGVEGYPSKLYFFNKKGKLLWSREDIDPDDTSISTDGSYVVTSCCDQEVWGVCLFNKDGKLLWRYEVYGGGSVSVSSDGSYVTAGSDGKVYFFNREGKLLWSYQHPEQRERYLFSIDVDAELEEDLNKGIFTERLENIFKTKGIPLDENIISAIKNHWDTGEYRIRREKEKIDFYRHYSGMYIYHTWISSDGNYVAATTWGNLYFFNMEGKLLWSFQTEGDDGSIWRGVSISSDGSYVVVGNYGDDNYYAGNLYFFNREGELLWKYKTDTSVESASISSDGSYVAVGTDNKIYYFVGSTPTVTPTLEPTEDAFNYQGEYKLDRNKLRHEESKALPYVMKYAKKCKVSPCLIMAVIRQESNFDMSANGGTDVGYMQVTYDAAKDGWYKGTEQEWRQKDGLDPDQNIEYGTKYLKALNGIFRDGKLLIEDLKATKVPDKTERLKFVLAAYNGGPGRIAKAQHICEDEGDNLEKWADTKKYLEAAGATPEKAEIIRNYVEQVIEGREDFINGQRRGYEFFLTIRVPVSGTPTPKPTTKEPTPEEGVPGFEAVFAIAGLLAVAYLLRRRE